jgi:hypothetical protein
MRIHALKATLKVAAQVIGLLLVAAVAAVAQTTVGLTAGPSTATLPDGSQVPMWGYTCVAANANCAPLNPSVSAGSWSPVIITVPTGQSLTINLTNNLSFTTPSGSTNTVPTSLVIVGQLGGGLGTSATKDPSPTHPSQVVTWSTVGTTTTFTPPVQPERVRSFSTEVLAGVTTALTWTTPRPGTYLIESGTHPSIQGSMGLFGIVVVTTTPASSSTAVGAVTTTTETAAGTAYPGVSYDAEVPVLLSEIDPIQNNSVNAAVHTTGFGETMVWSGLPGGCGNSSSATYHQCYPPAVNYTPLYYLINGVAFNRTAAAASLFSTLPNITLPSTMAAPKNLLVRLVNAGSRMHVPAIVGSQIGTATAPAVPPTGFSIIAEDGNPLPGLPRVQNEVFMAAGKTFDVMVNVPAPCVVVSPATSCANVAIPVYDRELSLSGNAIDRDAGMLAYLNVNGASLPSAPALASAQANADSYTAVPGNTLAVADVAKGVIANDVNVYGVKVFTAPAGTLALNTYGTFTYVPPTTWSATSTDSFVYIANGATACQAVTAPPTPGPCATVTITGTAAESSAGITVFNRSYNSSVANYLAIKSPGVLGSAYDTSNGGPDTDAAGFPLKAIVVAGSASTGLTVVTADSEGGFVATASAPGAYTFQYEAMNSQGTLSSPATVTVNFPTASSLAVTVLDGYDKTTQITDYRWIIEEDRTFYIDPTKLQNNGTNIVPTLGVNFHTSYMPYVAQGCTGPLSCEGGQTMYDSNPTSTTFGQHIPAVCDVGDGACRPDPACPPGSTATSCTGKGSAPVWPSSVYLDPTKRYYISVLPGDAANPFAGGTSYTDPANCNRTVSGNAMGALTCGHGMGGAAIATGQTTVTVLTQPSPYPPAKLSVFVFEDDFPLNGEQDAGGGIDVLAPQEPGLGGFQVHLWDSMAGNGDFTGQMTYDMFNQPLSNSLAGQIDPGTLLDACPISKNSRIGTIPNPANPSQMIPDPNQTGISGTIVTCPKYESDGVTLSPLAGQAVVANLMPGRWGAVVTPGADRIARGEEWLQTNTLDGQKAHDVFTRIGEPSYFQEFGPAGYHVSVGFANPAIINARHAGVCAGADPSLPLPPNTCNNTLTGRIVGERLSRSPDERLYGSGSHDAYYWTQCYISFGDPDGEDFAFTKCNADGTFTLTGLPAGDWRITSFDQWNDQLVDGLSTPVRLGSTTSVCPGTGSTTTFCNIGDIAATQWQTNLYTKTFVDDDKTGISPGANAPGIPFANVAVRLRDGSLENLLVTDFTGSANFNETFPLFSWYTVETDVTRYKNTGTHVVYDAGGPADGTLTSCGGTVSGTGYPPCGTSTIGKYLANTVEQVSVPTNLRIPGAVYCATADCTGKSIQNGPGTSDSPSACSTTAGATTCTTKLSTGRIDPPWVGVEGWQGFPGQGNFLEFGKEPYLAGENGGIHGHVIYASTRPFDDPMMLVQTQWEPLVPNVTINLYQEGFATDGVTPTLKLVDTTQTSSWDNFAQGFRADGITPNMNCPGQGANTGVIPDLFYFSLYSQPNYLDLYNKQHPPNGPYNPSATPTTLPSNSQYKCYDGMHNWNQIQPAPYDGMYQFPSVTSTNATSGKPTGTNCKICIANTFVPTTDLYYGLPMLPSAGQKNPDGTISTGKYVVEVVLPPGFELVKEEDKNILIGDNFIAPVTQEFGGLGNIFIIPDQASVADANTSVGVGYNANNAQNPTQALGAGTQNGIVPGFVPEPVWQCVGEARIVPDYISLYPQTHQVSPFAGATRNLCDRKEVILTDQVGAIAKFFIYTSTHIASKFTGGITDDYTSEFDPFSPQFGEKFAPPDLPISIKDWTGNEVSRVYADQWGAYDGMTYSTWEVNPPNPTGYSPTMMVVCMNDPGPIPDPNNVGQMITDPLFTQGYSQFCYELPFMPGTTQYLDTPVVPTSAFAGAGYNNVDCDYPDGTPAVSEVDGDGVGPWVSAVGHTLTITSLGDQLVANYAYSGPSATTAPFNEKTIKRHYGFGAQCTAPAAANATCNTLSKVTIGGVAAGITSWLDTQIVVTVPAGISPCAVQQQAQYGGSTANCGELVITAGNGLQSIDAVTVTVGGKAPTHVPASGSIQSAIDNANPGDLIVIDPTCTNLTGVVAAVGCTGVATATVSHTQAAHDELLIMWKPVRLQGVGAASSIINANPHPAGKLDPWRAKVNCMFGLAVNGRPYSTPGNLVPNPIPGQAPEPLNLFDPTGTYACGGWTAFDATPNNPQIDRLPLESVVGWDTLVNGNLAELLQEPSLMGAYEGAAITVLAKGVRYPPGVEVFGACNCDTPLGSFVAHEGQMPVPTVELSANDCVTSSTNPTNPFPSNFQCNPSLIDGLGITNSSQGGGGIFIHAWAHNLEIANNRIYNNTGTMTGGITVGQAEAADALITGNNGDPVGYNGGVLAGFDQQPWTCVPGAVVKTAATPYGYDQVVSPPGFAAGQELPFCYDLHVSVHNNAVTRNSSIGDEAFSATPAAAGGVTFCTGADYYKFNYNWICGNLSAGDGGGVAHLGFSFDGDIEHNSILFNQSLNPSIPANGGGLIVMNTFPDGSTAAQPECGSVTDVDCAPGLGDGIGPGLVINANLIMGNAAESGSGGGLRLQNVNGTEITRFPATPSQWYSVNVTNNIIADNVAGWDGAGISLQDALNVDIVNNTIVSNSTTASAGILFNTLGAPLASSAGPTCSSNCGTSSAPQVSGLVSIQNSAVLSAALPATITCPNGHYATASGGTATNGTCRTVSYPRLANDIFWENSAYYIGVGALSTQYQQNVVSLYNAFATTLAPSQPQAGASTAHGTGLTITGGTGACTAASYWDIGVRGDTGPTNHASGVTLNPTWSVLTNTTGYAANNSSADPNLVSQYCDGARTPPEFGASGWAVPPGISDATVPNPIFNLTPVATVDEGNNWVNLRWGPLSMLNPVSNTVLGNYALASSSPAIDYVPVAQLRAGTSTDFYGNQRPDPTNPNAFDVGAVEFQGAAPIASLTGITPAIGQPGTSMNVTLAGTNLGDAASMSAPGQPNITVTNFAVVNNTTVTATLNLACGTMLGTHTINVVTPLGARTVTFTVAAPTPTLTAISAMSGVQGTVVPVTLTGSGLMCASVNGFGSLITVGPMTVANGGSTITTTFTIGPTAPAGNRNVSVTTPGGTTSAVAFTVIGPAFGLSANSMSFVNQPDLTASASQPVTLKNAGPLPVLLTGISFTGPNPLVFAQTNNCPASPVALAAGASCTVNVTFAPGLHNSTTAPGAKSANLSVTSSGAAAQTVALTGSTTVATVSFSAPSQSLVTGATTAHSATITLTNNASSPSPGPLTVTATPTVAVTTNGPAGSSFTVTGGTCVSGLTVASGSACTIVVTYNPNGSAARTAAAHVTINVSGATTASQSSSIFNAN